MTENQTEDIDPNEAPDTERPPFGELTEDEVADGNHLGTVIDTDDDEDNGLGGVPS